MLLYFSETITNSWRLSIVKLPLHERQQQQRSFEADFVVGHVAKFALGKQVCLLQMHGTAYYSHAYQKLCSEHLPLQQEQGGRVQQCCWRLCE